MFRATLQVIGTLRPEIEQPFAGFLSEFRQGCHQVPVVPGGHQLIKLAEDLAPAVVQGSVVQVVERDGHSGRRNGRLPQVLKVTGIPLLSDPVDRAEQFLVALLLDHRPEQVDSSADHAETTQNGTDHEHSFQPSGVSR